MYDVISNSKKFITTIKLLRFIVYRKMVIFKINVYYK